MLILRRTLNRSRPRRAPIACCANAWLFSKNVHFFEKMKTAEMSRISPQLRETGFRRSSFPETCVLGTWKRRGLGNATCKFQWVFQILEHVFQILLQGHRWVVARLQPKLSAVYKFQHRFRNSVFCSLSPLVYRPRFSAARSAEIFSYTSVFHLFFIVFSINRAARSAEKVLTPFCLCSIVFLCIS